MALKIAYYGDPILRKKAAPVKEINDEIRKLVHDMIETMHAHNGIGLAGPQVHRSLRIFIMSVPVLQDDKTWKAGPIYVFINPEIVGVSEEEWIHGEGCLSIPTVYGDVRRPFRIKVRALNLDGEEMTYEFSDMEARCVLHENDHINGVLFIDRIKGKERKELDPLLRDVKKKFHNK